jgi:transcriptional regulator with XRE-family HTH domain
MILFTEEYRMEKNSFHREIISQFNLQKRRLGMSYNVLADKTDISVPTLKRIFSGRHSSAQMNHFLSIATILGVDLSARMTDPEHLRRVQAEKKARQIMELVRGNSALEDQHVSKEAYNTMMQKTVIELLAGPNNALWA